MLFFLFVLLVMMAVTNSRSRCLAIFIWLFLIFVYSFGKTEGDYEIYQWIYSSFRTGEVTIALSTFEPGFAALMWLCSILGLPFVAFRFIVSAFISFSLYNLFKKQTEDVALATVLYGVFPFFVWSAAMRSGMAVVFVSFAFQEFIDNDLKKSLKSLILFLIAILFHYSSVFFLVFFLSFCRNRKIRNGKFLVILLGIFVLTILLYFTDIPVRFVSMVTDNKKVTQWLYKGEGTANLTGILAEVAILMLLYLLSKKNFDYCQLLNVCGASHSTIRGVEVLYRLSTFCFLLLPFIALASPFMRIPYMMLALSIPMTLSCDSIMANERKDGEMYRRNVIYLRRIWIEMLLILLALKLYYDLPYLKAGQMFFSEFTQWSLAC